LENDGRYERLDPRTSEEIKRLPELRKERDDKKTAAVRALSSRVLDILGIWASL
jgi:hypothetical protein